MANSFNLGDNDGVVDKFWATHFPKITQKEFFKTLTNGFKEDFKIDKLSVLVNDLSFTFAVEDHKAIKRFVFEIDNLYKEATLGQIKLNEEYKNKGKCTQVLYNIVKLMDKLELDKLNITSVNSTLNIYQKMGYETSDISRPKEEIEKNYKILKDKGSIKFDSPQQEAQIDQLIQAILKSNDPKSLWLISDMNVKMNIGFEEAAKILELKKRTGDMPETHRLPAGKELNLSDALMLGITDTGHVSCSDKKVRERMNVYFESKQIQKLPEISKE